MLSMSGLWVLFLLIFIAAVPAIAVYLWFRATRYPFPTVRFLVSLLAGAAAFFPALVLQHFFPIWETGRAAGKWSLFVQTFIRIAFTEELSRFIVLLALFRITGCLETRPSGYDAEAPGKADIPVPALSYGTLIRGSAIGLVAGFGFAILESAAYGASDAGAALLRAFTAAPLHGACGSRLGAAVVLLRRHPPQAFFRFCSAVAIHGIYNFMIIMPGFPSIAAVLIALSALTASIMMIKSGHKNSSKTRPL